MLNHVIDIHDFPLHTPFAISGGTMQTAQCAIVVLRDEYGNTGIGEAAPFSAVSGQRLADTANRIEDFLARHKHHNAIDVLRAEKTVLMGDPSALCAVECALLGLIARQHGTPLWRLFGSPRTTCAPTVKTDLTVPVMKPDQVKPFLERFRDHKFSTYKVKVSGDVVSDIDSVLATHDWAKGNRDGESCEILLDGNQGYALDSAHKLLKELAELGINPSCFEQPLPKDNWKGLAKLSATSPVPLLLDESVMCAADVAKAARLGAGGMINIKITKSGVIESLRMIATARALGLGMMIGGMVETEIAMGFSLHMACGLDSFRFIDLDTPFFLKNAITTGSPWTRHTCELPVPTGKGLGLDLLAPQRRAALAEQETDAGLVTVTS
jgi:L-alanine-DL-glutamate epimerase-like enolase superfamily enzyme